MADPTNPLPHHDGWGLTAEQLDGKHCITCDRPDGPMRPVYAGPRGQLFRHTDRRCELELGDGEPVDLTAEAQRPELPS